MEMIKVYLKYLSPCLNKWILNGEEINDFAELKVFRTFKVLGIGKKNKIQKPNQNELKNHKIQM